MRKIVKEAAEMYALGAISSSQLLEECDSPKEVIEALQYAEEYSDQYDLYLQICQRERELLLQKKREIKEAWEVWENAPDSLIIQLKLRCDECRLWEETLKYSEELRYISYNYSAWRDWFFDYAWGKARAEITGPYLIKIAKEAREKDISDSSVVKFFKKYNLSTEERSLFWENMYPEEYGNE